MRKKRKKYSQLISKCQRVSDDFPWVIFPVLSTCFFYRLRLYTLLYMSRLNFSHYFQVITSIVCSYRGENRSATYFVIPKSRKTIYCRVFPNLMSRVSLFANCLVYFETFFLMSRRLVSNIFRSMIFIFAAFTIFKDVSNDMLFRLDIVFLLFHILFR